MGSMKNESQDLQLRVVNPNTHPLGVGKFNAKMRGVNAQITINMRPRFSDPALYASMTVGLRTGRKHMETLSKNVSVAT